MAIVLMTDDEIKNLLEPRDVMFRVIGNTMLTVTRMTHSEFPYPIYGVLFTSVGVDEYFTAYDNLPEAVTAFKTFIDVTTALRR